MHSIWKILFVLGANECIERLEGKIRKCLFFYVEILANNSVKLVSYCIFLVGNLGLMASIPSFLPLSTSKMRPLWNTQFSPKILFLSSLPAFCVPKMKVIWKLHRNHCYFGNTLFLLCFGKSYDFFWRMFLTNFKKTNPFGALESNQLWFCFVSITWFFIVF